MKIARYFSQILTKLKYSQQIFEKYSNIISWKSTNLEPSCSMQAGRQTDKEGDMMTPRVALFLQFANTPSKCKTVCVCEPTHMFSVV